MTRSSAIYVNGHKRNCNEVCPRVSAEDQSCSTHCGVTSSTFLDDLIDARVTTFDRVDADDVNQAPTAIDAL
ncbi:hypothetical protein VTO73DRAFT_4072 [Trametes versicolor]